MKKVIFWSLAAVILIGGGYFVFTKYGDKLGFTKKKKLTQEEIDKLVADAKAAGELESHKTSANSVVVVEGFPLSVGMTGEKIKALQVKLGVSPTSGYLGTKTNSAIQSKGVAVPVSESDYNKLMGIVATTTTKPLEKGKPVYLKGDSIFYYSIPTKDAMYLVGQVKKNVSLDKAIGVYVEPATSGWSKIQAVTFQPFSKETGWNTEIGYPPVSIPTKYVNKNLNVYVLTSDLSTSPY